MQKRYSPRFSTEVSSYSCTKQTSSHHRGVLPTVPFRVLSWKIHSGKDLLPETTAGKVQRTVKNHYTWPSLVSPKRWILHMRLSHVYIHLISLYVYRSTLLTFLVAVLSFCLCREEHIQALLAVRGDASREMRQMIIGTLSENKVSFSGVTQPIFKDIAVPTITMTTMTTMTSMATAKLLK